MLALIGKSTTLVCRRSVAALACLMLAVFSVAALDAQVIKTYDFEDGTAQGWIPFGSPVQVVSQAMLSDSLHAG